MSPEETETLLRRIVREEFARLYTDGHELVATANRRMELDEPRAKRPYAEIEGLPVSVDRPWRQALVAQAKATNQRMAQVVRYALIEHITDYVGYPHSRIFKHYKLSNLTMQMTFNMQGRLLALVDFVIADTAITRAQFTRTAVWEYCTRPGNRTLS